MKKITPESHAVYGQINPFSFTYRTESEMNEQKDSDLDQE